MQYDNRCPLAPDELRAYASEHLVYELRMLRETSSLLPRPEWKDAHEWAMSMALLESFVLHGRVLVNFLYPSGVRADDIIAHDFFSSPGSWGSIRPTITSQLRDFQERANKEVAHLTARRISGHPVGKNYERAIFDQIEQVLQVFAERASTDRLDVDVRSLIAQSPAAGSRVPNTECRVPSGLPPSSFSAQPYLGGTIEFGSGSR